MQNNSPIFSIIVTTYNRLDLLKRCLDSIKSQTYKKFEVIVYDDGSTDGTREFFESHLEAIQKDFPSFQYIWKENWGGPARGRNYGLGIAKGEWISFLDSDDWWKDNRLENLLSKIHCADVIYHELAFMNSQGEMNKTTNGRELGKPAIVDLLVNGNCLSNSATIFKKSFIEKTGLVSENHKVQAIEDYDLWLRLAKQDANFLYLSDVLGYYWVGEDNISTSSKNYVEKLHYTVEQYLDQLDDSQKAQAFITLNYIKARNYQNLDDIELRREAKASFKKVFFQSNNLMLKLKSLYCFIRLGLNGV